MRMNKEQAAFVISHYVYSKMPEKIVKGSEEYLFLQALDVAIEELKRRTK